MNEEKLKQLLKQADEQARLLPLDTGSLSSAVRGRLHRRKMIQRSGMVAVAAMIMVVFILGQRQYLLYQKQQQIVQLEERIEDLNRRTEQTLALVQDMLARQQQQKSESRLASYHDPIQQQVEEAAFILVYQADRMAERYNNTEAAIDYYNQVIERFGDTPSAKTARQRIKEIEKLNQPNQI